MSLAYVLSCRGQPGRALGVIDRARADLTGVQRGRATAQRGAILQQLGRLGGGAGDLPGGAAPAAGGARLGVDLAGAQQPRRVAGLPLSLRRGAGRPARGRASSAGARGWACSPPTCRRTWASRTAGGAPYRRRCGTSQEAERQYRELGVGVSSLLLDRAELLLSVRLAREAQEAAEQAVAELTRSHGGFKLPEGHLMVATAALLARRLRHRAARRPPGRRRVRPPAPRRTGARWPG